MKQLVFILLVLVTGNVFSQCDIKTNNRPDGSTIKYFTPKPVAKTSDHEAGLSLYYNVQSKEYTLTIFLLYKNGTPTKLNGDLIIQTTGDTGISLKSYRHELVTMNGKEIGTSIYYLTQKDIAQLEKYPLKTLSVKVNNNIIGLTITENKNLIIKQFSCLN
jgi:hypothetical protein